MEKTYLTLIHISIQLFDRFTTKMNAVILNYNKKIIIVPENWIENSNQFSEQTKIYYSPNFEDPANFTIPVKQFFDRTVPKCYNGFLLQKFCKRNGCTM